MVNVLFPIAARAQQRAQDGEEDGEQPRRKRRAECNLHSMRTCGIGPAAQRETSVLRSSGRIPWPGGPRSLQPRRRRSSALRRARAEFPTKTAEKKEEIFWGSEFFFLKWACASRFQWGMFILLAAEKLTFLGGGITSKLARQ